MSDSDDDWFDKDVDEMVNEVQKKSEQISVNDTNSARQLESVDPNLYRTMLTSTDDYGGTYGVRSASRGSISGQQSAKQHSKSKEHYIQPMSGKKLEFVSEQAPLEAFLEVVQIDSGFNECFDKIMLEDQLRLAVRILAKISSFPAREHVKEIFQKSLQSAKFLKQIEKIVTSKTCPSTTLDEFMDICWAIEAFNMSNDWLTGVLLKVKKTFEVGSRVLLARIEDLLVKLSKEQVHFKEIYPTPDELIAGEKDVIRPNIVKGKYSSVQDYLETHLSLLREDFIGPLRDRISELRNCEEPDDVPPRDFYKSTKFLLNDKFSRHTAKGELLVVDLKASERKDDDSEDLIDGLYMNPKKLMFGSLLCFSSSLKFNDLILAVVSYRDHDTLLKGYVYVEIIKLYNTVNLFNHDFIMFESQVFFEPYQHVHRVIRQLNDTNFPMADYIVDVKENQEPPNYLRGSNEYYYKFNRFTFNPLQLDTYPSTESLQFDASQRLAYQQSLSRKFCLIQGPPGTGKTFIGLKIVSTLLENVTAKLLIICYTNHALDQFLSGILAYTNEIVRMGNQSKNELLNEYNLKQVTDGVANSQHLRASYYNTKKAYATLMGKFHEMRNIADKKESDFKEIFKIQEELRRISAKLDELKQISDYNLIKNKKVIGMTTTYAARSNLLLKLLKIPIVIVEEAAEVLESHIVAALTPSTEHLILIGDHQQLRPTTSVYQLSEKYKMDISLFERMINNKLNCVCLNTQHRMRPEIANLIRPLIYKDLRDAANVESYDRIRGVAKNLYFVNHDFKEIRASDESTKRNLHEAQFLLALANYLLITGHKADEIVILATYNGQMFQLMKDRKSYPLLERVRITVVDNYQGEENKIILLSLVRNNSENSIGYLAMRNRICVALSRAQMGFYAIGAIDFFAQNNSIWNSIKTTLQQQEAIGNELPLECTEHGRIVKVRSVEDFKFSQSCICCQ